MPFEMTVRAESAEDFRAQVSALVSVMFGASPAAIGTAGPATEAPKAARNKKAPEAEPAKAETAKEPEVAEPETMAPSITMEELRAAMGDLIKTGPMGAKASVDIITELEAFDADKMPKLANVKPEDFAKCLEMIKAATAKASAGAGVL